MATSYSGGRSRSARTEPPTMGKQLVYFITCGCESSKHKKYNQIKYFRTVSATCPVDVLERYSKLVMISENSNDCIYSDQFITENIQIPINLEVLCLDTDNLINTLFHITVISFFAFPPSMISQQSIFDPGNDFGKF
jgi:hypothetical protein